MKIDIITIFPEVFDSFIKHSIIKSAILKGIITINFIDLRDYSDNKHRKIDDTPYGGGAGMLMQFPPFYRAIQRLKEENSVVIYLSPQGKKITQRISNKLCKYEHIIILCGHYEGIDARVLEFVDFEMSIGDYVISSGEVAAMVFIDSLVRLVPGVIQKESIENDSLYNGLLKSPQYTKPEEYNGFKVPDILLSGHHANIEKWRYYEALKQTFLKRKDLLRKIKLKENDKEFIDRLKNKL